jgi:regulator of protease activity HflC (stomatin/prohibitin superfamily)
MNTNSIAYAIWAAATLYFTVQVLRSVRVVPNRTELLVERLGRYDRTLGPGVHLLIPFIDKVAFSIDLKEEPIEVPPQDCFTRDNVRVEVDGVLYMKVVQSKLSCYGIVEYRNAIIQLAQTMVRSVIGKLDLDHTLTERERINSEVVTALNDIARTWGVLISRYEVKNIVPPTSVRDAMEKQMAAERDRRALLARAEGEKQARLNDSEGKKQEMINRSLGEMQRRINEAEGKAEEILAISRATADSLRTVAESVAVPGGKEAVNLRLGQALVGKLGALASGQRVVLPLDLTKVDDLLKGIGLDTSSPVPVPRPQARVAPAPSPQPVVIARPPSVDMPTTLPTFAPPGPPGPRRE